jgi:hypothetical protein
VKTFLAVFLAILAAAAVIVLVAVLFFGARSAMQETAINRRSQMYLPARWLRTINLACITYASTYNRGWPASLAQLGPPTDPAAPTVDHAGLIPTDLAAGNLSGYIFTYSSESPDPTHRVTSYQISAIPEHQSDPPLPSFYTDQSGVVRETRERRAAGPLDPPIPPDINQP